MLPAQTTLQISSVMFKFLIEMHGFNFHLKIEVVKIAFLHLRSLLQWNIQ